jgi:hypothetical protein
VDTRANGAIEVVGEPSDTAPDGTIEIHLVHPIERCVRKMSKVPPLSAVVDFQTIELRDNLRRFDAGSPDDQRRLDPLTPVEDDTFCVGTNYLRIRSNVDAELSQLCFDRFGDAVGKGP